MRDEYVKFESLHIIDSKPIMKKSFTFLLFIPLSLSAQNFTGINVNAPTVDLDVRTLSTNKGAEVNVGNIDNSYFLRMFSGRDDVPFSLIYWKSQQIWRLVDLIRTVRTMLSFFDWMGKQ